MALCLETFFVWRRLKQSKSFYHLRGIGKILKFRKKGVRRYHKPSSLAALLSFFLLLTNFPYFHSSDLRRWWLSECVILKETTCEILTKILIVLKTVPVNRMDRAKKVYRRLLGKKPKRYAYSPTGSLPPSPMEGNSPRVLRKDSFKRSRMALNRMWRR